MRRRFPIAIVDLPRIDDPRKRCRDPGDPGATGRVEVARFNCSPRKLNMVWSTVDNFINCMYAQFAAKYGWPGVGGFDDRRGGIWLLEMRGIIGAFHLLVRLKEDYHSFPLGIFLFLGLRCLD